MLLRKRLPLKGLRPLFETYVVALFTPDDFERAMVPRSSRPTVGAFAIAKCRFGVIPPNRPIHQYPKNASRATRLGFQQRFNHKGTAYNIVGCQPVHKLEDRLIPFYQWSIMGSRDMGDMKNNYYKHCDSFHLLSSWPWEWLSWDPASLDARASSSSEVALRGMPLPWPAPRTKEGPSCRDQRAEWFGPKEAHHVTWEHLHMAQNI